ncbi:MAG: recombinase family protein [Oscillospiraceae bacterium]|nr:recombinase family protein [Oscillospiraceae bacterium]
MIQQSENRVQCLYRVSGLKQVHFDAYNQADIPMQKKACREYVKRMGWIIVNEEQETGSGYKNSASSRDAIKRIKERVQRKEFDILLVFMFDRIGRITNETPFVVEWLIQSGIRVVSVMEGEQCITNHVDHLVNYIRYWISEGESQKISMRARTRLAQLVEEGHGKGGIAPYGYRYEQDNRTNRHGRQLLKLVVHDSEAETVRMIYDRYVNYGYRAQRISSYLHEQHLKTRSGKNWHPSSIKGILRNLTYSGVLRCGEARSGLIQRLQIIDDETFSMAQKIHEERSEQTKPYVINKQSCRTLLAGNIYCRHCGSRLVLTSNHKKYTNKQGETKTWKQYRYTCYGKTVSAASQRPKPAAARCPRTAENSVLE